MAGYAFDTWGQFLFFLSRQPKTVPAPDAQEITSLLALVSLARVMGLRGIRTASLALDVLKRTFVLDDRTLRYLGKVLHARHEEDSLHAESLIRTLHSLCSQKPDMAPRILSCLVALARDEQGCLDRISYRFLTALAQRLGLSQDQFESFAGREADADASQDPYAVLGITPLASAKDITQAYRRLMVETHPDRLRAHMSGLALAQAEARAAHINAAYNRIKKARAS